MRASPQSDKQGTLGVLESSCPENSSEQEQSGSPRTRDPLLERKWVVKKEIRIFGMQRSGNHAIINWITKQQPGYVFFLNHGDPLAPFDAHRDYQPPSKPIDLFVHSYEDHRFSPQLLRIADSNRSFYYDLPKAHYDLLVLRDPLNLFASRLRSGYTGARRNDRYNQTDLWLTYAEEYLGKTQSLGPSKVPVSYNQWCTDEAYRKNLARCLGLQFSDAGFNEVPVYGGGSSFEGRKKNGQASDMNTRDRWKHFVDDESFITCFRDPRIINTSEKIFGKTQGASKLVRSSASWHQRLRALLRGLAVRHIVMRLIDLRLWLDRGHYLIARRPCEKQ
jgi:hypothetical protein